MKQINELVDDIDVSSICNKIYMLGYEEGYAAAFKKINSIQNADRHEYDHNTLPEDVIAREEFMDNFNA